jgi:tyrosyl-tRNA synthetase
MESSGNSTARLSLIRENLSEILNAEIIEKIIDEGKNPKIYWGKFLT